MKKRRTYWHVAPTGMWWHGWKHGWLSKIDQSTGSDIISNHATISTLKQADRCAMQALRRGANSVEVFRRFKKGSEWYERFREYTLEDLKDD